MLCYVPFKYFSTGETHTSYSISSLINIGREYIQFVYGMYYCQVHIDRLFMVISKLTALVSLSTA